MRFAQAYSRFPGVLISRKDYGWVGWFAINPSIDWSYGLKIFFGLFNIFCLKLFNVIEGLKHNEHNKSRQHNRVR